MTAAPLAPEGITNPPIDSLLERADSKYSLVIYAAKRARQINAYYAQLSEGLLEYVGPLVEADVTDKPLTVALREVDEGKLHTTTPDSIDGGVAAIEPASAPSVVIDDVPGDDGATS